MFTFRIQDAEKIVARLMEAPEGDVLRMIRQVKDIPLLPRFDAITELQLVEFFELKLGKIWKCSNKSSFNYCYESDVFHLSCNKAKSTATKVTCTIGNGTSEYTLKLVNGKEVKIPEEGIRCYKPRAVLVLALYLDESETAEEIRKVVADSKYNDIESYRYVLNGIREREALESDSDTAEQLGIIQAIDEKALEDAMVKIFLKRLGGFLQMTSSK